jgi:hypothetical protein
MSALSVGSYGEVKVKQGGAKLRYEQRGDRARSASNKLRTDSAVQVRIWSFETYELELADANSLLAQLAAIEPFNGSGDIIGSTVSVLGANINADYGGGFGDVVVSFELEEAAP